MKFIFTILIFFISLLIHANNKTIRIGIGLPKPPFIMEDLKSGIELEIVEEVFKKINIKYSFSSAPQARIQELFRSKLLDVAITQKKENIPEAHFSDDYVSFQNYAISLKQKNFQILNLEDIANYKIAAFHNAKNLLGENYSKIVEKSSFYNEFPLQIDQIKMLLAKRVDVIILEKRIFDYQIKKNLEFRSFTTKDFNYHNVFKQNAYQVGFQNILLRDQFNKELKNFKDSKKYQEIFKKYALKNIDENIKTTILAEIKF